MILLAESNLARRHNVYVITLLVRVVQWTMLVQAMLWPNICVHRAKERNKCHLVKRIGHFVRSVLYL